MKIIKPYDIGDDELMSIDNIAPDYSAEELRAMKEVKDGNDNNTSAGDNDRQ